MEIPGLGKLEKDEELGWYYSASIPVEVLNGQPCRFVVEGYDEDLQKEDFHIAIKNFLSLGRTALNEAAPYVFQYYEDCNSHWDPEDDEFVTIATPNEVWRHVQFGQEPSVSRRHRKDKSIYISLECNCDWEQEHGLQIVFRNGLKVNKIGPFGSHLTNADAFADDALEDVVYRH